MDGNSIPQTPIDHVAARHFVWPYKHCATHIFLNETVVTTTAGTSTVSIHYLRQTHTALRAGLRQCTCWLATLICVTQGEVQHKTSAREVERKNCEYERKRTAGAALLECLRGGDRV